MAIPHFLALDLDDTILDYDSTGAACWNHYCRMYSEKLQRDLQEFQIAVAQSRSWYWADMRRYRQGRLHQLEARRAIIFRAFKILGIRRPDLADEFAELFTQEREEWIRPFPGAIAALETMRQSGALLALITNGQASQQRAKIDRFDLSRFFKTIWIEGERGIGKPEPCVFENVLKDLRAPADAAWMIGDDVRFDIRPARGVGLHTAWIDIGREADDEVVCDLRAPSLIDLIAIWSKE